MSVVCCVSDSSFACGELIQQKMEFQIKWILIQLLNSIREFVLFFLWMSFIRTMKKNQKFSTEIRMKGHKVQYKKNGWNILLFRMGKKCKKKQIE